MKKINLTASPDNNETETQPITAVDATEKISQNQTSQQSSPVRPIAFSQDEITMKKKQTKGLIVICLVALIAGATTGFGAHRLQTQTGASSQPEPLQQIAGDNVANGDVFGSTNSDNFKDSAQGFLEAGGIEGEGSHKLLRAGGVSQTVYLTSTVTDLDKLVGMEVKVWGETYNGQVAGWLMDVGKIEIINIDAQPPVEEEL